ncbi:MAG: metal-dependent transcriptional regulator [Chloroflexi bacterium]|nr:metal-dependent transcriptional regulator [Chloroflexota bacterium]
MTTSTIEEYLEAIYVLSDEEQPVIGVRLAEALHVSPPTVTVTLKRMVRDELIDINERKEISLTAKGREMAETLLRRHRLSERWLADVLGVEWHKVHEEACRLEHAISAEVEERLSAVLGNPTTCPHGNPIGLVLEGSELRLDTVPAGGWATVRRIAEQAESNPDLLRYFREKGLVPGAVIQIVEIDPFAGSITLRVSDEHVFLAPQVAANLWIEVIEQ